MRDHGFKGGPLKRWTSMAECTRAGLAREVAPSWPSPRVLAVLARLGATHGMPPCLRRDNGPECIALASRGGLAQPQRRTLVLDPGCPWQQGYGESFKSTGRDACLPRHVLPSVAEARGVLGA